MSGKRMLILDAETVQKIEENRGDMGISGFLNYLIDTHLELQRKTPYDDLITKEEFTHFEEGIRELLRSFLEFFLSYGLELGKQPGGGELEKFDAELQGFSRNIRGKKG